MVKNELIIIDKIEKRLRAKNDVVVFPLTPTHRKELRELRDTNVGNLKDRLNTIKQLKKEEYQKKYNKEIGGELEEKELVCKRLNDDWGRRIKLLNKIISERKELEDKTDIEFIEIKHSWDTISELKEIEGKDRKFCFNKDSVITKISDKEFENKYETNFKNVSNQISDIVTKYEEAINFGDLEIVKELYYIMKSSDKMFEKISKLKI